MRRHRSLNTTEVAIEWILRKTIYKGWCHRRKT